MSLPSRVAPCLRALRQVAPTSARPFTTTVYNRKDEEWPQRMPIGKFYESVLNYPTPYPFDQKPEEPPNSADPKVLPADKEPVPVKEPEPKKAEEKKTEDKSSEADRPAKKKPGRKPKNATASSPPPSTSASPPTHAPPPSSPEEKARIIFGTRLASPDDAEARLALKANKSTVIAGVTVPPKPEEPDNCCMSGCVNCVWDFFREDMEEYTAKKAEATQRLRAQSGSMDADGGGSETNWQPPKGVDVGGAKIAKDMWDEDVFKNVPVGIREFMKQEKRLKERHEREGSLGG